MYFCRDTPDANLLHIQLISKAIRENKDFCVNYYPLADYFQNKRDCLT